MVLPHHCQLTAPGAPWDSSSEGEAEGRRKTRIVFLNLVVCAGEVEDGGSGREGRDDSSSLPMTPRVECTCSPDSF